MTVRSSKMDGHPSRWITSPGSASAPAPTGEGVQETVRLRRVRPESSPYAKHHKHEERPAHDKQYRRTRPPVVREENDQADLQTHPPPDYERGDERPLPVEGFPVDTLILLRRHLSAQCVRASDTPSEYHQQEKGHS